MKSFQNLVDEIIKYVLETAPVRATAVGVHEYDHLLDVADSAFRRQRAATLRKYLNQLTELDSVSEMSDDERIDYQILSGNLQAEIFVEESHRRWERDPSLALEVAMFGCYMLILHESRPLEDRAKALLNRLQQVPRLLSEAMNNLLHEKEVPTVWAEMGEELSIAGISFFSETIPAFSAQVPDLNQQLLQAGSIAANACLDYFAFLKEKLTNRSRGSYALGAEGFNMLLTQLHGLRYTGDDLDRIGEKVIEETMSQMTQLASQVKPSNDREEIIAMLKQQIPGNGNLVGYYQKFVDAARQHLLDHDLVTVPSDENLRLVETPLFARNTYPFAAYLPSPPFASDQQAFFWVTPIDSESPPELQQQQRQGHNKYQALVVALHEAYPGHHLQLQRANHLPSKVRKLFDTSVFVEGWALYCEEMMYESGYYPDAETRLMQLNTQLWRACRVVIDVALHNGKMTFTDAVNMLVNTAKLERTAAIAEVKRYTQQPTQPMSYIIGKMEILKLRDDYQRVARGRFRLKDFHDQLLSHGSIPVSLVRRVMLEQK